MLLPQSRLARGETVGPGPRAGIALPERGLKGRWRARRWLKRRGLITLSLDGAAPDYLPPATFADPEITDIDIFLRRLRPAHDGLRIVHLTDIHHGLYTPLEEVQRAVQLTNSLCPDVVAITGDFVTLSPVYIAPVARTLGKLRARLGVFAVLGNHDFHVDPDKVTRALVAQRIHVLRNSHCALNVGGATLWMIGVDDIWWRAANLPAAMHRIPARDTKILLCHNPRGVRRAAERGIDLVLSGHTHGGQVRLPVVGSIYGRSKFGRRFIEGWNRLDGTQIYINRGIGKVLVPVRFGCPAEIACLRLRRAAS